jgi:hypothetical protein
MGFNRRDMESRREAAAEKEAAARRALDPQILEDAERLVAAWNERQAGRMPSLFSPTIGAITAQHYFLWVRCPACRTTSSVDLRTLDWHRDGQLSSVAVVSILPTERTLRRIAAVVAVECGRRVHRVQRQLVDW